MRSEGNGKRESSKEKQKIEERGNQEIIKTEIIK
jgi:hypothetical protein